MNAPLTPELFTAKLEPSGQQCDAWADQTLLDSIEMGGLNLTAEEKAEGCVLPCVAYPDGDVTLQDPEN